MSGKSSSRFRDFTGPRIAVVGLRLQNAPLLSLTLTSRHRDAQLPGAVVEFAVFYNVGGTA